MAVRKLPGDPGPSEFSWGAGLMPPPDQGYVPTVEDQLHALFRVSKDPTNLDQTALANYDDVIGEA